MKIDKTRVFELKKQGLSEKQIADTLGTSVTSVSRAKRSAEYKELELGLSASLIDDIATVQRRILALVHLFIDRAEKEDLEFQLRALAVLSRFVNIIREIKN